MLRISLIYGGIAGAVIIGSMLTGFALSDGEGFGSSQLIGYLFMIVALSLIFMGIKRYRDQELGGVISFGKAFQLGLFVNGDILFGVALSTSKRVFLNWSSSQF